MTKAQVLQLLDNVPMDCRITISITPADTAKAKEQSVFGDSYEFGFTGESAFGPEGIELMVRAETE